MTSWFESLFSGGAIPAMDRGIRFAAARHRLIVENIANADTPGYRRKDLDPLDFREALRAASAGSGAGSGILRHDQNNVDLEQELGLLAKNAGYHNQMALLLRKAFEQIRIAVAERAPAS